MRLGIRLQVLLALGALLVLAFVPLFFAVASLTRATLRHVRADSAVSLGRAVAAHVAAAAETRAAADLEPLLSAQLGAGGVSAVGVYDARGRLAIKAAEEGWEAALPETVRPGTERIEPLRTPHGSASLLLVPNVAAGEAAPFRAVAVLVRTDTKSSYSAPLLRLVALYTGIVALGLLVLAYIAMTRLVVRPLVELEGAARRVREGGRRFDVAPAGPAEIADLSVSVAQMTERLRVEEEQLRAKIAEATRYAADLQRAQERLVRSERLASVGRLAAGLAHEIGNPISAILGFQDLLLMGGLSPEEERDFLERMKRETERIHKVLRDLLDFARPAAAPREGLGDRPSSVADAVSDAVALVRPQKDWKRIALETQLAEPLPPVQLGHGRVVQVLLNLLLNAGDVVPKEGGRVLVRAARDGARVRIEVEDNGPGIAKEIEPRLFEPFATTKDVGKGTGLGLAVCRGLVESVGGTIAAERGAEGGAKFVVELPAAE
jgi:signal transduction histidine kinase